MRAASTFRWRGCGTTTSMRTPRVRHVATRRGPSHERLLQGHQSTIGNMAWSLRGIRGLGGTWYHDGLHAEMSGVPSCLRRAVDRHRAFFLDGHVLALA